MLFLVFQAEFCCGDGDAPVRFAGMEGSRLGGWRPDLASGLAASGQLAACVGADAMRWGFRLLLLHDGWGTAILQAVRPIAQREIPAYAGMTWVAVGMTRPGGNDGESNLLRTGRNPCLKSNR